MVNIGEFTYQAEPIQIFFHAESDLTVGKYCSIAAGCKVFLGGNHRGEWISTYPMALNHSYTNGPVTIGNDVWIGYGVTILSGVTIGDGAMIGAMSVVAKDVPDYGVVAGNPAELKKFRFAADVIEKLLEIKWWDWDAAKVRTAIPYLMSTNMDGFFEWANESV